MSKPLFIPGECKHARSQCAATVRKVDDLIGRFTVDITIVCKDCGAPFRFLALSAGESLSLPCLPCPTMARLPLTLDNL